MKKNHLFIASAALLSLTAFNALAPITSAFADEQSLKTAADVNFVEDDETTKPVDPTDPTDPIDPTDPVTPTPGPLSIDYASSFHFGEQKISAKDQTYNAELVDVTDSTGTAGKRQNWVQITDKRGTNAGWTLTVKQEQQLTSTDASAKELKGAEIKIMNAKPKTSSDNLSAAPSQAPAEITLTPSSEVPVMAAKADEGTGTWVDSFGDETNGDKSISLTVPGVSEKVKDATYSSDLTWTLSDTPA